MSETLDLHRLKAEHMLRRARLAALGESFVILTLLVWLSLEYQNNFYMQQWLAAHFWPAQWLLNGTLVGVATGLMVGWILATWQGKRSREQKILDDLRKIDLREADFALVDCCVESTRVYIVSVERPKVGGI